MCGLQSGLFDTSDIQELIEVGPINPLKDRAPSLYATPIELRCFKRIWRRGKIWAAPEWLNLTSSRNGLHILWLIVK